VVFVQTPAADMTMRILLAGQFLAEAYRLTSGGGKSVAGALSAVASTFA
jgi:hypothetical protein